MLFLVRRFGNDIGVDVASNWQNFQLYNVHAELAVPVKFYIFKRLENLITGRIAQCTFLVSSIFE